ncbi:MAG: DUF86 domain-containing protein [Candidatus Aminicenantes bacterium]|nr:DUF86 domain-containing protein [Candidatus Aminicenantes bacterium]
MREIRDYFMDIKTECEYLINRTQDLTYENFVSNEELKRAFVRSLEIIGEAAKHIPKDLRRKYSHIKWKSVIGTRNILIHEYFGVDYLVVWKVVKEKIPELYEVIKKIIEENQDE